ncbi:SCO7460 family lipoprotein [Nonomuraea sp. NPDC059023]|uniref:SCO7460 family lipoprotein n=1 Tax=unclassified Nonomuraea TaxID=2593643 RepID=UPI0036B8579C
MERSRRRRRWAAGLLGMVVLAGGCSLGTGDDRSRAEELAGKLYPGRLKVVGARNLFPETNGSEIMFALAGDPDAVVRLRIDAEQDTCDRKPCESQLAAAVRKGEELGENWRRLAAGFQSCGHPIIAANAPLSEVWIEAAPTNATIASFLGTVRGCLGTGRALAVNFATPAVAAKRPRGGEGLPTFLRMTETKVLAALSGEPYLVASYSPANEPSARIVRPFDQRQEFEKRARAGATEWLAANRPGAMVGGVVGVWRLRPGRVDRLMGYVLFCETQQAKCQGDRAVAMTVDPQGNPVGDMRVVENIRDQGGVLRLPAGT